MLRFEDLRVRDQQTLDREFFNRRFRLIAENLAQVEDRLSTVTTATNRLVTLGLNRINEVLSPLLTKVQAASESGFLVATSSTPLTLTPGLTSTLVIDDTPARALFAPTPFVLVSRQQDDALEDWAMLRVQSYTRDNGGLAFEVKAVHGTLARTTHDAWVLSASAGLAPAVLEAAVAIEATLAEARQAAEEAEQAAASAASVIANGPVSSVNGRTGAVSLGLSDIPNLVASLGAKAESNHGHAISQITNLQATLNALQTAAANPDGGSY